MDVETLESFSRCGWNSMDDMGLGKTVRSVLMSLTSTLTSNTPTPKVQAATFLSAMMKAKHVKRALVVVPVAACRNGSSPCVRSSFSHITHHSHTVLHQKYSNTTTHSNINTRTPTLEHREWGRGKLVLWLFLFM